MWTSLSGIFFATGGIIYAFEQSNLAGKFVIAVLVMGSLFSWTVMIAKFNQVRRAKEDTHRFLDKFRESRDPLRIFQRQSTSYSGSPAYHVYLAGCRELSYHLLGSDEADDTYASRLRSADKLSAQAMNAVRTAVERVVGEQALLLEDRMILLATAVSGAPFLGLLGTVWGVMDTFGGIAMAGKANLSAMAPGVSGALITTVTGLLVAIPAMFGYNFLVVTVRKLTVELDNFASELVSAFEHQHLDTK